MRTKLHLSRSRDARSAVAPARGERAARAFRLRFIVLLATLLAFSWQNFLADTHHHEGAGALSASVAKAGNGTRVAGSGTAPDQPANCPICRELVHAVFFLPTPAPVALDAPALAAVALVAASAFLLFARRRTHFWQSRAPPSPLQA